MVQAKLLPRHLRGLNVLCRAAHASPERNHYHGLTSQVAPLDGLPGIAIIWPAEADAFGLDVAYNSLRG